MNKPASPNKTIALQGISKSFGLVHANRNISIQFCPGIITALLGENGAGKSTLLSILAGRLQPDSGSITIDGMPVRFRSPKDAHAVGIGMVYQHFMLVDSLTVAENVLLGQEGRSFLSPRSMEEQVDALAGKYSLALDASAKVGSLSMGERQRVEILKLLLKNSNLLIFDEPTAVLTSSESEQLFKSLRQMALVGKSIVFISHKLDEVLDIADEVAILRQGELVEQFDISHVPDKHVLAEKMMGRSVGLAFYKEPLPAKETVLEVENLVSGWGEALSFSLKKGEIFAITGVAGNGQKRLVETLAGMEAPVGGTVQILDQSWHDFYSHPPALGGLAYIPEDRQGVATCPTLSLVDNLLLTARTLLTQGIFILRSAAYAKTAEIIRDYEIKADGPDSLARSLSGGNLQKLVIGREFLRKPSVIIAESPTQGLDVAATEDVWARLVKAREHAGILLVTGDLSEALQLADRIAVMYQGRFVDCFHRSDEAKVAAIGSMMAGVY